MIENTLLEDNGFLILPPVFSENEMDQIISIIETATDSNPNFRKTQDLFAIRNLLGEIPALGTALWTPKLNSLIDSLLGKDYFNTKAIYFDKPALSNWSVAWHQDTTISVDKKADIPDFGPWTLKQGLQAVQPSLAYMSNIWALRIHLDDCDATNGALKVVPGSHLLGFIPDKEYPTHTQTVEVCDVAKGEVMFMKPLLLHASNKSTSDRNRRVIHLEFSSLELPAGLQWRERQNRHYSKI